MMHSSTHRLNTPVIPDDLISDDAFYYLASPYSGTVEEQVHRTREVWSYSAQLARWGIPHYSPIWATHEICQAFQLPGDVAFWWRKNLPFLKAAHGLIIAAIDGWGSSHGIAREAEYMVEHKKPVYCANRNGSDTFEIMWIR